MNQRYIDLAIEHVAKEFGFFEGYARNTYNGSTVNITAFEAHAIKYAVNQRAIVLQVEDVLIVNWITVKGQDYRKALNDLVTFNQSVSAYHRLYGVMTDKKLEE